MKTRTLVLIGAALLCALAVAEAAPAPVESGQLTLPDFRSPEDLQKIGDHLDLPGVSLSGTGMRGNDPARSVPAT